MNGYKFVAAVFCSSSGSQQRGERKIDKDWRLAPKVC